MKLFLKIFTTLLLISACAKEKEKPDNQSGMTMDMSDMVHLNERQRNVIELKVDTAKVDFIFETSDFTGIVQADENNVSTVSSRVSGRIDELNVRNEGEAIRKGQLLYSIYSEELLSDENEYIYALNQKSEFKENNQTITTLIDASRKRLLLWGLSEAMIDELAQTKKASATTNFYSEVSGYLAELNVSEGEYVTEGTALFKISSLNTVWVEATVYQDELSRVSSAEEAEVEIQNFPGKIFKGKIILNPPALDSERKAASVRIGLKNTNGEIKPGMMALVSIRTNTKKTLVIPKSALILGEMISVWVESTPGMYQLKMVETGIDNKFSVEILSGLNAGDRVVTSGSYLINSAYILQHGANSMPGMEM